VAEASKNIIIGVFVLAAIVVLVWLVLFIHPTPGNTAQRITVRFANIEKIQVGTRVTFAGEPVGQVAEIISRFNGERNPRESAGPMFFFEVVLAIDSHVRVYETDLITTKMTGLFGERVVAIIPRRPPPGVEPRLVVEGIVVYARAEDQVDQALGQLASVSSKMVATFQKLSDLIDANSQPIRHAIETFDHSMEAVGDTFRRINEADIVGSIGGAFDGIAAVMDIIENDLRELEEQGMWKNTELMMERLANASANVEAVTGDLRAGRGTIGRLLKGDDLYLEVQSLLAKAGTIMNDINHYGLLFWQNRRWQRERTQRANLLSALEHPHAFRSYFDQELDAITTSLVRVELLLEEMRCSCRGQDLLCNPCFAEEFATLLRHVQTLEEQLGLYNEMLNDCRCCR
jgi:phospholipid/cholesterol/gamma-HCH transport system substrate-binding protein